MPTGTIRARSTPYRDPIRTNERICKRCGILFTANHGRRDLHITHCRDCRDIDANYCGTPNGYSHHYKRGEPACDQCRAARNRRDRKRRAA